MPWLRARSPRQLRRPLLPAAGGASQTYAIITKSAGNPYNEREASGFEEAIKAAGYTAIIKHPAEITAEAQITLINELVAQGRLRYRRCRK